MQNFFKDFSYAIRMLAKYPGFTAVAVLTLALGIGANTAIFSFVNAALLKPLPYASPERLYVLGEPREQMEEVDVAVSYPDFQDWRRAAKSFESLAGYTPYSLTMSGSSAPESLDVARVTPDFFPTLGVSPVIGRDFQPADDLGQGARVVILSHEFWKSHYGNSSTALGQVLHLNGAAYNIIGVLPKNFEFAPAGSPQLWLPLNATGDMATRRGLRWLRVVGRTRSGISFSQAFAEMQTINASLAAAHPSENRSIQIAMRSLRESITGRIRPLLLVLFGAVGFVLMIACANVAHLTLARATTRKKEIAVRVALGAGRFQIVRQLLTESLLLSLIGGALGLLWAVWGIRALISFVPERTRLEMPYLSSVHADMTTLFFLLVLIVLTGIAFGIVPALQVSKSECADTLREESRTSAGNRSTWLRDGLVVAELSVSIVLLTGAGLMVRSLSALLHQNPGFDRTNLLTFVVNLPEASYKDDPAIRQFAKRLSNALQELPGVKETAVISKLPVTGNGNTIRFLIEGRPKPKGTEDEGSIRDVSTSYFSVMKIPILKGRTYEPQDAESSAPQRIVINQAFADRYLAGENPIGKRVRFTFSDSQPYQEIIGVVANESTEGLDAAMQPIMYSSFERGPDSAFYVVMRTPEDPQIVISSARLALRGIDPGVPMIEPRSMEAVISDSYAVFLRRFPSRLITGFAVLALILAVIGLYGQISFGVAQRTREIGVRMALGAEYRDVLRLIVGKGLLLTSAGVLIGIAAALALTRLLTGLLFGVTPNDPSTFAAVVVLLATVSLAASLVPARRAARIDPIVALRYE
jgi:putative ABC transport system permease protein